jgi:DNA polymerase III subunit delta'
MWDDIIGHKDTIVMLRTMLAAKRTPHALLFTGPQGVGKMKVTQAVAAELLQAPLAKSPDYMLIAPEGTNIKIDQIRALQHQALLPPYGGRRRVCILEEAERMTEQAANSLLKLLEEPPAYMVFILVASTAAPLLPTIVSRCRVIRFQSLPHDLLAQALVARGFGVADADLAARLSGGRLGRALSLLVPDGLALRDRALALVEDLPGAAMGAVWAAAGELEKLEDSSAAEWRRLLMYLVRDLLVSRVSSGQHRLLFNCDQQERLLAMALIWDERRLQAALTAIQGAERALAANANRRLTYEALLIQLRDLARGGKICK